MLEILLWLARPFLTVGQNSGREFDKSSNGRYKPFLKIAPNLIDCVQSFGAHPNHLLLNSRGLEQCLMTNPTRNWIH